MTPIDDELRISLRRQADGVLPLADPLAGVERRAGRIRRRRVAAAVASTALAVVVVAVAVPMGIGQLRSSPSNGGFAGGGLPTPPPSTVIPSLSAQPPPNPPPNILDWPARGALRSAAEDRALEAAVTRAWAAKHGAGSAGNKLWEADLPGGGAAGIWQMWTWGSRTAYTVVGQRLPDGVTFIVLDQVTPKGVTEISSVLAGGAFPHVVVLGPPTTGQISYAADGLRLRPVERLQGFVGGDGWAIFDRTGGGQQRGDLIEVLDGNGRRIYRGPIDVGPSFPDK